MFGQSIDAVFEAGMLKPLAPLDLQEHEQVTLIISRSGECEAVDSGAGDDYVPLIAAEGDPSITWEEVQGLLAKLPRSLSSDFDRARDERF